jgi:hypothetical protein
LGRLELFSQPPGRVFDGDLFDVGHGRKSTQSSGT